MSEIESTEGLVLWGLLYNEDYCRKVIPFLKDEYFQEQSHKLIFGKIDGYLDKYNAQPSKEALIIDIEQQSDVSDNVYSEVITILNELHKEKDRDENVAKVKHDDGRANFLCTLIG